MYVALLGRFVSRDPIGYEGGNQLYRFCSCSPTNHRDPSGLVPINCKCKVSRYGGFQVHVSYEWRQVECTGVAATCCTNACTWGGPLDTVSWTGEWENIAAESPSCNPTFWDEYTNCSKAECESDCATLAAGCVSYCSLACAPLRFLGTPYVQCMSACTTPCWSGWGTCHLMCRRCKNP